jgi:hypothetical protein
MPKLLFGEKDFKTWDNLVLDEFVYVFQRTGGDGLIKNGYIERYLHSKLYCYCIVRYRDRDYHIVIEAFSGSEDTRPSNDANNGAGETRDDFPMFINTVDLMKPPKRFRWKPIRSIVRLKAFNDRMSVKGNISQFSSCSKFFIMELTATMENGEFCTSSRLVCPTEQRELPRQMVKGRSKIIGNLSNEQPPFWRGSPVDLKLKDIGNLFRLALWDDLAWFGVRVKIHADFPVENCELFICPDDFEFNAIERMHILQSLAGNRV